MTEQEVCELPGKDNPVKLLDGKFGILIRYGDPCGVQVHGEKDIRWLSADCLEAHGEALLQIKDSPLEVDA